MSDREHLVLATYNVHGCVGVDRKRDPERVAAVILELDADVIALQEVAFPSSVDLDARQPIVLSRLTGYEFVLGPTMTEHGDHFGNVLLVRHPIRSVARLDLSVDRREPRGALDVTVDIDGADLRVVTTHLGLRTGERRSQVDRLLDHIDASPAPFLAVLGDFNDWLPGRSVLERLEQRLGKTPRIRSFPVRWPLFALDRIWVHPGSAVSAMRAHRTPSSLRASDHLPVVATVVRPKPERSSERTLRP